MLAQNQHNDEDLIEEAFRSLDEIDRERDLIAAKLEILKKLRDDIINNKGGTSDS